LANCKNEQNIESIKSIFFKVKLLYSKITKCSQLI
jgi:hypothetical protein